MLSDMRETSPPFYFRRHWSAESHTDADEVSLHRTLGDGTLEITLTRMADLPPELREGIETVTLAPPEGLMIYGRAVEPIPEDRALLAPLLAQGQVYAECFSTQCRDGETGTHPLAAVTEISRGEFEAARSRGWS